LSPLRLAIHVRNARAESGACEKAIFIRLSDIRGVGSEADGKNVLASVRKVTRLEFERITVVTTLAVDEVVGAKSLGAVVTRTAAPFGRTREMHRHRRCTHLTCSCSAAHAVAACAAHSLVDVCCVAEVDPVSTRCFGCTRQAALLMADVAGGHRVRRARAVALEAGIVCGRARGDRESSTALIRLVAGRTRDTCVTGMNELPAKGLQVRKAL